MQARSLSTVWANFTAQHGEMPEKRISNSNPAVCDTCSLYSSLVPYDSPPRLEFHGIRVVIQASHIGHGIDPLHIRVGNLEVEDFQVLLQMLRQIRPRR